MLMKVSLRGTMTHSAPRSPLAHYLNLKLVLCALQSLCAIFGIIAVSGVGREAVQCDQDLRDDKAVVVLIILVAVMQFSEWFIYGCGLFCLQTAGRDSSGGDGGGDGEGLQPRLTEDAHVTWENRCRSFVRISRWLTCNLFGGNNVEEGFQQVARVLTTFFHHDGFLDVVASDIVAAIVLVRVEQRSNRLQNLPVDDAIQIDIEDDVEVGKRSQSSSRLPSNDVSVPLLISFEQSSNSSGKTLSLEEYDTIFRCSVFALAAYSHLIYMFMKPCTGACNLACYKGLSSCLCFNKNDFPVVGDNYYKLHTAGMENIQKFLKNTTVVFASFKNDTTHKPFIVFLDHDKKCLIIAIRGTLSLEDCLTDATCEPFELSEAGEKFGFNGKNRWVHEGFFHAAEAIYYELESNNILSDLIGNGPAVKHPNYSLMVTGHSLGAGIGSCLSLLLRKSYPSLRCYTYGTPGSVFDEKLCAEVSSFTTSVVLGNDIVCRLNFHSLSHLRNDILDCISRAKVNKMFVMKALYQDVDPLDLLHPIGQEPDSEFKRALEVFKSKAADNLAKFHQHRLSIPGKIVHYTKTVIERRCLRNKVAYFPTVKDRSEFSSIVLSSTMGADHLPDKYYFELENARNLAMSSATKL